MSWRERGRGQWVTVRTNPSHRAALGRGRAALRHERLAATAATAGARTGALGQRLHGPAPRGALEAQTDSGAVIVLMVLLAAAFAASASAERPRLAALPATPACALALGPEAGALAALADAGPRGGSAPAPGGGRGLAEARAGRSSGADAARRRATDAVRQPRPVRSWVPWLRTRSHRSPRRSVIGSRARSSGPPRPRSKPGPRSRRGENVLVSAPTGSGKTLAAFLWALDRLVAEPGAGRLVYVSPLKALSYDVEKNLRARCGASAATSRWPSAPATRPSGSARPCCAPRRTC